MRTRMKLFGIVALSIYLSATAKERKTTLFERVGGMDTISVLADKYVDFLRADPEFQNTRLYKERKANGFRGDKFRRELKQYYCYISGGPCPKRSSPSSRMLRATRPSSLEWDDLERHFTKALGEAGIDGKDGEEFLLRFRNYRRYFDKH